jgi:hypothetical protein
MRNETERGFSSASLGHTDAQLDEAELNLERCLEALDERGEPGLQAELDRLYPQPQPDQAPEQAPVLKEATLQPKRLRCYDIECVGGIRMHVCEAPEPLPVRLWEWKETDIH